jgi:hypothetical protein
MSHHSRRNAPLPVPVASLGRVETTYLAVLVLAFVLIAAVALLVLSRLFRR